MANGGWGVDTTEAQHRPYSACHTRAAMHSPRGIRKSTQRMPVRDARWNLASPYSGYKLGQAVGCPWWAKRRLPSALNWNPQRTLPGS